MNKGAHRHLPIKQGKIGASRCSWLLQKCRAYFGSVLISEVEREKRKAPRRGLSAGLREGLIRNAGPNSVLTIALRLMVG